MSSDLTRVYQFLATQTDWRTAADCQNADGVITKAEFREFMEENFANWNGESNTTEDGLNDLINAFWKTIDTKQSGSVSGTKYKNKNALDANEMAAMDNKIAMYEVLNDFTSKLSAPSVVSNTSGWKKDVSTDLAALVEKYTGSADDLAAYLEEQSPAIENKNTADYCASEYLNSEMGDFVKEYSYTYADDSTLQDMINTYIQNIPEGSDVEEIKETIINMIDAYLATAGLKEDNGFDLSQFGYTPGETASLNDLQKSVLTKDLQTKLASSDIKEDYENNAELFASAITSYVDGLKFTDFETVSNDVLTSFRASDAYKGVEKNIQVQELLVSEDFHNALKTNISESIADTIVNDGKYLTVMKEIQEEALTKAQNGDFDVNGKLDTQTAINWLVDQISSRLAEFYPNGFGDMSLDELNVMYDKLVESADKETDVEKQLELRRNAAIQYCDALAEKSTKFEEIVKSAFGDNYKSEIGKMLPSQIDKIIEELKAEAAELGDANELQLADSSWASLAGDVTVEINSSQTFNIQPSFTDTDGNSKTITTDRISYESSNTSLASVDKSTGKVTINGTNQGTYTVTLSVLVDGVEVGKKTVTVKVQNMAFDWSAMSDEKVSGTITLDGNIDNRVSQTVDLATLYNSNGCMMLANWNGDWGTCMSDAKKNITSLLNTIKNACANSGYADTAALETAYTKTLELYTKLVTGASGKAGNDSEATLSVTYDGEKYTYFSKCAYYESTAEDATRAYSQGGKANASGIQWNYSDRRNDSDQILVNVRCVMDIFNKFYKAALA